MRAWWADMCVDSRRQAVKGGRTNPPRKAPAATGALGRDAR